MTDRPILFSADMINANLREIRKPGTGKRCTRRVLMPQPENRCDEANTATLNSDGICRFSWKTALHPISYSRNDRKISYRIGDRLWVREHWKACSQMDAIAPRNMSKGEPVLYLADNVLRELGCMMIQPGKHRQAMHMPRWASRMTLIVNNVRIERLQDISARDAIAEGITQIDQGPGNTGWRNYSAKPGDHIDPVFSIPRHSFQTLWDSINGKPRKPDGPDISWDANPWVIAIDYTPHLINIDQMEAA